MEPNQIAAFKLIEQAQLAMKKGEYVSARQLAAQAAQTAPELEEVWLLMAALASPRGSVAFLQKALAINPQSERAQKGMVWAQNRLQQELEKQAVTARTVVANVPEAVPVAEEPVAAVPEPVAASLEAQEPITEAPESEPVAAAPEEERPVARVTAAVLEPKTAPVKKPVVAPRPVTVTKNIQNEKTVARRNYSNLLLPLVGIIICLVSTFLLLRGTTPAAALINSNVFNGREHGPAWADANVAKPIPSPAALEVVVVPTAIPPSTPVPEMVVPPTATNAPLSTETPLPTNTPVPAEIVSIPTGTQAPTETPLPTDLPTATAEVASVEDAPSPTPLPTDTAVPAPTPYIAPTAKPTSSGGTNTTTTTTAGSSGERWIDVDLTHQMVYAYEGNALANSFLVSTGTWQHPTVTGQYHVYVKYRSTTMSGPGYSLPNVPFTMYFYKGYGLHGTYWHSNFGTPMSHGCVNLSIPDSEWLYNWASVGTLVNVHY
jgi:lipoprotein-anchoring transpeptidase ErfK/SrfK